LTLPNQNKIELDLSGMQLREIDNPLDYLKVRQLPHELQNTINKRFDNQTESEQHKFVWTEPKCHWIGPVIDGKANGQGVLTFTEFPKDHFRIKFTIDGKSKDEISKEILCEQFESSIRNRIDWALTRYTPPEIKEILAKENVAKFLPVPEGLDLSESVW